MSSAVQPFSFLSGREILGTSLEGWNLDQPPIHSSDRVVRMQVTFSQPFNSAPLVHLGLTGFDISELDCARLTVSARKVTAQGFEIELGTWFNTRLWRVEVSWLALGA